MSLALSLRSWSGYLRALTPFAANTFIGIGLFLLLLAATFALHTRWSVRSCLRSSATVTENVAAQDAQGGVVYTTRLRFQMPGGRIVNFADPIQSSEDGSPSFAVGKVVPVLYPAGQPDNARIATIWRLYFVSNILSILGVILIDVGLILRLVRKKIA